MTKKIHFVHVYTTIRVKVEVEAEDHRSAMEQADILLSKIGEPVRFCPNHPAILDAADAEEITGYLVDEKDDEGFTRSRNYGSDHEPD